MDVHAHCAWPRIKATPIAPGRIGSDQPRAAGEGAKGAQRFQFSLHSGRTTSTRGETWAAAPRVLATRASACAPHRGEGAWCVYAVRLDAATPSVTAAAAASLLGVGRHSHRRRRGAVRHGAVSCVACARLAGKRPSGHADRRCPQRPNLRKRAARPPRRFRRFRRFRASLPLRLTGARLHACCRVSRHGHGGHRGHRVYAACARRVSMPVGAAVLRSGTRTNQEQPRLCSSSRTGGGPKRVWDSVISLLDETTESYLGSESDMAETPRKVDAHEWLEALVLLWMLVVVDLPPNAAARSRVPG